MFQSAVEYLYNDWIAKGINANLIYYNTPQFRNPIDFAFSSLLNVCVISGVRTANAEAWIRARRTATTQNESCEKSSPPTRFEPAASGSSADSSSLDFHSGNF